MYIIIVGAGEVGSYLARILIEEKHDVAIVEIDERVARELDASLDALIVQGSGVSHRALRRAGIEKADLVLAVTEVDEVNLIACMTATKFGKPPRTVARVRDPEYLGGRDALSAEEMGLSLLVGPEQAVAGEIVDLLSYEGSGEAHYLADGRLVLLELSLDNDSPLVHETLAELADVFPTPSLVVAVNGPSGFRIPRGDNTLRVDERAYVLTTPEHVDEFWILSGKPWHHVRHTLIIGCGNIGFDLARRLEGKGQYPTIIEADRERAEWVSKKLKKSIVLHGDGTDAELLREQLDERADAVVVLLEDDEKAILVGLFARYLGAKKVIVRSDKPAYAPMAHKFGVDALISPRRAVADEILRFVRAGKISGSRMLGDHAGEILEFKIPAEPANPDIIGRPLRELEFPDGSLIGAVIHGREARVASGDTVLAPGDDLLVISMPQVVPELEKMLT